MGKQVIHIASNTDGYEIVELLANKYSRKNQLSVIGRYTGEEEIKYEINLTGGFILNNTPRIREMLDRIPKEEMYSFITELSIEPFVQSYYVED